MTSIPSPDWPRAALGALARFQNGFAFKPADWGKEGKPIIRIQNLTQANGSINHTLREVPEKFHVYRGDLLYSWSATLGAYFWEGEDAYLNQHIFKVIPDKCVDKEYLYYTLQFVTDELSRKTHGSTMKHVTKGDFEGTEVPLPPLPEQRRIVDILNRANGIRRLRREAQEKARLVIPALFVEMFTGAPSRTWPNEKIDNLLADKKGAIRTGPFGSQLKHSEFIETGVPVLGIDNVVQNIFRWTKPRCLPLEKYERFKRFRVVPGDVLVTIMGTAGRVCVAPENLPECMSTKHLCVLTLDQRRMSPWYLWGALLYDDAVHSQKRGHGAIMEGWNMSIVRNLQVRVPPLPLQQAFASRVSDIQSMIAQQDRMAAANERLVQSLMGAVFS